IDSTLQVLDSNNASLAFNDDVSGAVKDSLIGPGGTGTGKLNSLGPGSNYRLHMANFGSTIGNGAWAVDLIDSNNGFTAKLALSPNSMIKTFTMSSGNPNNYSEFDVDAAHPLSLASGGVITLRANANLLQGAGTVSAAQELIGSTPQGASFQQY